LRRRPSSTADGLTGAGLARLHAVAEQHVGDTRVPGLVALVARGPEVHVEALGRLTIGGPPVARDSIFRIASTTKPLTAAATLAVVAEGAIGLDDPVDRLLPELAEPRVLRRMDGPLDDTVPAARAITTRDACSRARRRRSCTATSRRRPTRLSAERRGP
jgi:CubicO group peptidase (beta-lactamase class C family)